MSQRKLKIACAGLGRMGARHALNFANRTLRADLVAAFTPDPKEKAWAATALPNTTVYTDYDEMLNHLGLDAAVIATVTTCQGIKCREATSKRHGAIRQVSILRSQICDKLDPSGFFVTYAEFSGGIFVDCNIHDIDLALWYFGQDSVMKSVVTMGITAVQPDLRRHKDVDNSAGVVEFWDGKIAYFYSSRMMAAGQHDMTEIIGTKGKLSINANPQGSLAEIYEPQGVQREIPADYYGRFEHAFVTEANEFTAACFENTKLPFILSGAVQAVTIGCALQESLNSGQKIFFDETGGRIEAPNL
ncbi:hypothetical protein F4782DRAFT_548814 [Xylaria castorea]|nr:hypothetical protein F4782DRAFT_548814 [Xylaria castorea]